MWKEQLLKPTLHTGSNVPKKPKRSEDCLNELKSHKQKLENMKSILEYTFGDKLVPNNKNKRFTYSHRIKPEVSEELACRILKVLHSIKFNNLMNKKMVLIHDSIAYDVYARFNISNDNGMSYSNYSNVEFIVTPEGISPALPSKAMVYMEINVNSNDGHINVPKANELWLWF